MSRFLLSRAFLLALPLLLAVGGDAFARPAKKASRAKAAMADDVVELGSRTIQFGASPDQVKALFPEAEPGEPVGKLSILTADLATPPADPDEIAGSGSLYADFGFEDERLVRLVLRTGWDGDYETDPLFVQVYRGLTKRLGKGTPYRGPAPEGDMGSINRWDRTWKSGRLRILHGELDSDSVAACEEALLFRFTDTSARQKALR